MPVHVPVGADVLHFRVVKMFFILTKLIKLYWQSPKCFFILKGDYDVVINDYEKAKSLFGKTEVQVFKKCKIYYFKIFYFAFIGKLWNGFCKEC